MDTRRLDLNLLLTLEALLVEQNVTRAAARLHLSQPAVSAQLSRLRDLFEDPLLIPAHRGMTPTARAVELLDPLRQALDQVRATLSMHSRFDPATARLTLAVACTDYLQWSVLMPFAIALRQKAPGVQLAIRNLDPAQLEAQMTRGDIDLALMTPQTAPPGLRFKHLFDERYVLIGRRGHPRLKRRISAEAFARLDHVIVSPSGGGFATPTDQALAALGLSRNVVLSAASFQFVPGIVARSDFVALVPQRLLRHRSDALEQIELQLPVEGFSVGIVWHERTHSHPGHRWIRDEILAQVNDDAGAEA